MNQKYAPTITRTIPNENNRRDEIVQFPPIRGATNRAHAGKARIKSRLIADLDPEEWDFPPKPKWMRWETYKRYEALYDHYEEILDYGCFALVAKLGKNFL
jgi:hypothetical protein